MYNISREVKVSLVKILKSALGVSLSKFSVMNKALDPGDRYDRTGLIMILFVDFFFIRTLNKDTDVKDQKPHYAYGMLKAIDVMILNYCLIPKYSSPEHFMPLGFGFMMMWNQSKAPKLGSHKRMGFIAAIGCILGACICSFNTYGILWVIDEYLKTVAYIPRFQFELRENSYGYDDYKIIMMVHKALYIVAWIFDCYILNPLSIIVQLLLFCHFTWNIYPDWKKSTEELAAINLRENN